MTKTEKELKKEFIRYEDELEKCGIPTKTWKQAGQMELQD